MSKTEIDPLGERVSEKVVEYWKMIGSEIDIDSRGTDQYTADFTDRGWEVLTGADNGELNMACIYDASNHNKDIGRYKDLLQKRNIPGTLFVPEAISDQIIPAAQKTGFQHVGDAPLMVCSATSLYPVRFDDVRYPLDIIEVYSDTKEAVQHVAKLQNLVFGFPTDLRVSNINPSKNVRVFMGRDKGEIVTTITTIEAIKGRVGVWCVATKSDERGRGYAGNLLNSVMNSHIQQGAENFHLISTEDGKLMYEKRGFQEIPGGRTNILEYNPQNHKSS